MGSKRRTIILGGVFILLLVLGGLVENMVFLGYVKDIFVNPPLGITIVFLHNVIAVSLIIIGMTFYVEFVLTFIEEEDAVLHHPRLFAIVFTAIILTISIIRVGTLLHGQILISPISIIMYAILPHGIVEFYGTYQSIHKTLKKILTIKGLAIIYLIFFFAAILEVGFVQALLWYAA